MDIAKNAGDIIKISFMLKTVIILKNRKTDTEEIFKNLSALQSSHPKYKPNAIRIHMSKYKTNEYEDGIYLIRKKIVNE